MAKAVRWEIPFQSVCGTNYRIDIYDEQDGSWSGVTQLLAGDTPIKTTESNNSDFFTSVRSQTGNIQICSNLPIGGMVSVDDIMPKTNTSRPVHLVSIAANNTEKIEWIGFLSCEMFTQDYIGIPQNIELPIISVLEAMDSVSMNKYHADGIMTLHNLIYAILNEPALECGMTLFTDIYYSLTCEFVFKKLYSDIFYEYSDIVENNEQKQICEGMSCKEAISMICRFLGLVIREQGSSVFLSRVGDEVLPIVHRSFSDFGPNYEYANFDQVNMQTINISSLTWKGTGHKRSIAQAAKSVEVVSDAEEYSFELHRPKYPNGPTTIYSRALKDSNDNTVYGRFVANKNTDFSDNYEFIFRNGHTKVDDVLPYVLMNPSPKTNYSSLYDSESRYGAFMCKQDIRTTLNIDLFKDFEEGIYITGYRTAITPYGYDVTFPRAIVTIDALKPVMRIINKFSRLFTNGSFFVSLKGKTIQNENQPTVVDGMTLYVTLECGGKIFGITELNYDDEDRYVDYTAEWLNKEDVEIAYDLGAPNLFPIPVKSSDGYIIPLDTTTMTGDITLNIYAADIPDTAQQFYRYDKFIEDISVEFKQYIENTKPARKSESKYIRLLDKTFKDEISIDTKIASLYNNAPSYHIMMNNDGSLMETMRYYYKDGNVTRYEERRPEADLLNRLAAYYAAARQRIELIAAHPTAAQLPMLKLNGINDGKVYLPLSESRDWQTDVCKLTCFEMPQQPAESQ